MGPSVHQKPSSDSETADITIVHPWDPWNQAIGGFDTCLDSFLRYAPIQWKLEIVGLTKDRNISPVGQWVTKSFAGRSIKFFAVLEDNEPDRVRRIPLSLRFVLACRLQHITTKGRILEFHRFESAFGVTLKSKSKKVHFLHNHPEEIRSPYSDIRWHFLSQLHDYLLVRQLRNASLIVPVDPRTPAWVTKKISYTPPKIIFQNEWADPAIFNTTDSKIRERNRASLRAKVGAAPDAKVILFAGRLEIQKDPMLLLDAFALLHKHKNDVWLVIVGKGRLEGSMKTKVQKLGLLERVIFLRAVPREEMPAIYRAADVFICTSGFEGGPRTIFEALTCGTPVVSFDVGQAGKVLRNHLDVGRLIEKRSPEAIAQALEEVLERQSSISLQQLCTKAVVEFTPQNALAPIFDVYDQWLNEERDDSLLA